ncbi:MAG: YaaC family protein [Streptosporangiaceae bacterium]
MLGAAADLLGVGAPAGIIELGAAWSALPEVEPPPGDAWPLALPVWPEIYDPGHRSFTHPAFRGFVHLRGRPGLDNAASIAELLKRYPAAAGASAELPYGGLARRATPFGEGVSVVWPRPDVQVKFGGPVPADIQAAHVVSRVPVYRRTGEHWLIPVVGAAEDCLPPVLLWWVLLFGLSLLARYEAPAWKAALDLDTSPCASPLMDLLDSALEIVPDLLHEAITAPPR